MDRRARRRAGDRQGRDRISAATAAEICCHCADTYEAVREEKGTQLARAIAACQVKQSAINRTGPLSADTFLPRAWVALSAVCALGRSTKVLQSERGTAQNVVPARFLVLVLGPKYASAPPPRKK